MLTVMMLLFVLSTALAQVGVNTVDPKSTFQVVGSPTLTLVADGFQGPILSLSQLDAKIAAYSTEQNGAIIYINDVSTPSTTTETSNISATGYYYYDAPNDIWKVMGEPSTTYSVGDFAQGGIVFWVDETGQHGLVAAKEDHSTSIRWNAGTDGITRATGDGPFSGELNTTIIIASQVSIGDDGNDYAGQICNDLQITEGGKTYGDWYLPSREELNVMFQNKATIDATALANGGAVFSASFYWSSTEDDSSNANAQNLSSGFQFGVAKGNTERVRAVRAF